MSEKDINKEKQKLINELSAVREENRVLTEEVQRLESSEEKFRSLVENIPDVTWTTDCEGNTVFISPNIKKVYGYTPEEIAKAGDSLWLGRIHPDDLDSVKKSYGLLFEKSRKFDIEYRIQKKDGQWIWLHDKAINVYEKKGVMYADGIFTDVTRRKQIEVELKQSEDKFRSLFESSNDAIVLLDENGFFDCNDATLKVFGFKSREVFCSKHPVDLSPPRQPNGEESRQAAEKRITKAFSEGRQFFEWTHRRPNGEDFPAEILLTPVILEGEKILQGTIRDITDRKELEETLRRSYDELEMRVDERTSELSKTNTSLKKEMHERKQVEDNLFLEKAFNDAVLNTLPGIFYIYEEGERLIRWNQNHETATGYSAEELLNKHPLDWFEGEDKKKMASAMEKIFIFGTATEEANLILKNGSKSPYFFSATVLKKEDKKYILGVGLDITNLKKVEGELRKLLHAIEQTPASIIVTDIQGKIEYVNPKFCSITGYSYDEVIGQNPRILNSGEQSNEFYQELWETITSGKEWRGEFHNKKKGGGTYWESASISPVKNNEGVTTNFIAVKEDITEIKKVAEALRISEDKFSKVFYSSPDSITVTSLEEGILVDVNKGFETLFGYQRDEIIGKSTIEIDVWLNPEDRDKIVDILKEDGSLRNYEVAMKNKLGEIRTVSLSIELINLAGRPHSVTTGRDISERKQAEEALLKSNAEFEAIFKANDDAVAFTDTSRQIRLINPAFTEIFGYTHDDVEGKTTEMLYADNSDYKDQGNKRFKVGANAKQPIYEMRYRRKDGTEFISETMGAEVKNVRGDTMGFIGIMRDITERKLAEQALKETQARHAEAQHLAHLGDWDLDLIENKLIWSDEVFQIFELDSEKFGASYEAFIDTIHPDDRDFVSKAYTDSVNKKIPYDIVHRLQMKDGRVKHIIETCKTFYGEDGKPARSVGTVQDITEKVLMEEKAKIAQAKLIQTNKMASMGMLASSITHEINNPNNYIQHNASLLSKVCNDMKNVMAEYYNEHGEFSAGGFTYSELQKRIPQFIDGISDGSMRIKNIVDGIKGFARQDKGGKDKKFNIKDALKDALSLLDSQVVKFTSNFHVNSAEEIPPVKGSKQQIEQVIINFIMNALQALPDRESAVSVSTSFNEEDRCVIIEIKDEGSGIEEDVLKNMMEPFYSTRLDSGGTGLGLFISSSIIEEHEGTLGFETEIGIGTTATIRLPLYQREAGK